MTDVLKPTFGRIEWCKEDIENALDMSGHDTDEENVSQILCALDEEKLIDAQIEAGWQYIYSLIDDAAEKNLLK